MPQNQQSQNNNQFKHCQQINNIRNQNDSAFTMNSIGVQQDTKINSALSVGEKTRAKINFDNS